MGIKPGFREVPAGATGTVPPAGLSIAGGFAALDGDAGVWGSVGPEALRASVIPPWAAAIHSRTDTQNPATFIASSLQAVPLQSNCRVSDRAFPCVVVHTGNNCGKQRTTARRWSNQGLCPGTAYKLFRYWTRSAFCAVVSPSAFFVS